MSMSPAGPTGLTPNGTSSNTGAPRRRAPANPLVQKKPLRRPRPSAPTTNGTSSTPNDSHSKGPKQAAEQNKKPAASTTKASAAAAKAKDAPQTQETPKEDFVDYPVVTTKKALLEGLRHHVMRLSSRKPVNPMSEAEFTRPVRLHRRDPRAPPSGAGTAAMDVDSKEEVMDDKEREKQEAMKAERQAIREANQAQIAPTAAAKVVKPPAFKKKTEQVFRADDTPEARKRSQLRYEEALPWHLEDFDNKNTWVGNYEAALSECHVMLMVVESGFRMVPLEKWYKFTSKNHFKTLTIEEAEERMGKKYKEPRWVLQTQMATEQKKAEEAKRAKSKGLFTRKAGRGDDEKPVKTEDEERPEVAADVDDIDYNLEEAFADDEQDAIFGGDEEENKVAEERIKREQLGANLFGKNEDKDFDAEEDQKKMEARLKKRLEKGLRKALTKREKNYVYENESESNPYTSEVGFQWCGLSCQLLMSTERDRGFRDRKTQGGRAQERRGAQS